MKLEAARLKAEKPGVKLRHQWIPLARMGNNIKRAVIASEDQKFLHHDGVDWDALELAMEKHIEKGKGGGGSTITQQVVKNVFLSHKKSYIRKGREILISLVLDYIWPKSRILEVYLNTAEFGILDTYAEFEKLSRTVKIMDTVRLMKKVVPEFKSKNSPRFEVLDK